MELDDNAGLEDVVERMEEIYRPGGEDGEISDAMTRGDFWYTNNSTRSPPPKKNPMHAGLWEESWPLRMGSS